MSGMSAAGPRRGLVPLLVLAAVVTAVTFGLAQGLVASNLHNGLLALAFTAVAAYVLAERPGHPEGRLFLATGVVESVMFLGRQIGHFPDSADDRWWGWFGVWPLALALALTTLSVLCFPDGRLPSPRWAPVAIAVAAVAIACSLLSALWPVEYADAGVRVAHPWASATPPWAEAVWSALAHPAYVVFQVLWIVAVALRWRGASPRVRRQLVWLIGAACVSVLALLVGLVGWGSPRAGVLSATLMPVAAGWAIVHGQYVTSYTALSWLSRRGAGSDLPSDLSRPVAEALSADAARLWVLDDGRLHAVGEWPPSGTEIPPTTLAGLESGPARVRRVTAGGRPVGAISVDLPNADPFSATEARVLDDLAAQAVLVVEHLGLSRLVREQRRAGHVDGLSPREQEVLALMARGLSNAAICEELHVSVKTVEPIVSSVFTKLGLRPDAANNRRVLAVVAYLRG